MSLMKHLILLLVPTVLLLSLCAFCEEVPAVPENGAPLTEADLGVLVGEEFFPVFSPVAPLIEALGEPDEFIASPSCVFDGEDKEYDYAYCWISTNPIDGDDLWFDLYLFDEGLSTLRGLSVGDSAGRAIELYGEDYYVEGEGMMTWSLSGDEGDIGSPCIIVETEDDIVTAIDLYWPTNV